MRSATPARGYFRSGLPFNRIGHGPRPLVVVQGLLFEHKPQPRFALGPYSFLGDRSTVFVVLRRPGMPPGYSMADMAADVATTIRQEFGGPVDVIGVSTGGSIVQHLAADHPDVEHARGGGVELARELRVGREQIEERDAGGRIDAHRAARTACAYWS